MTERWVDIEGYEGRYEVSNLGNVRRVDGRMMKNVVQPSGYMAITFPSIAGKPRVTRRVHVMVAAAFLGPRPAGLYVLHNDDDKSNNRLENLRYGTPKSNVEDKRRNGRLLEEERHWNAKFSRETVALARGLNGVIARAEIAAITGIRTPHLCMILLGRCWKNVDPMPRDNAIALLEQMTGRLIGSFSSPDDARRDRYIPASAKSRRADLRVHPTQGSR